jgi:hypothetical protein
MKRTFMVRETLTAMRAFDYPFAVPDRSFVFAGGEARDVGELEIGRAGRTALLAYGSNAAPEVLARKLAGDPDPALLLRAALRDFDAVYSDHLSAYGAVPATLKASPGTTLPVFVAYLTAAQLELIALTEPNYELASLQGIECRLEDDGELLHELDAYLSRHGHLPGEDGSPLALSAIPAAARSFVAIDQDEAKRRRASRASAP